METYLKLIKLGPNGVKILVHTCITIKCPFVWKQVYIYLLFSINHHNLTRYREIHIYNIYNIQ